MNWLPSTSVTSVLILLVLATAYGIGRLDWHRNERQGRRAERKR
jgi:hypothetical protein